MPASKKPITFAPDEDIRKWYDALEEGRRTKILNRCLRAYLLKAHQKKDFNPWKGEMPKDNGEAYGIPTYLYKEDC